MCVNKQKKFSLKRKLLKTHLSSSLYLENSSFDVTLVSDDQVQFHAHKCVVSACSSVLKNLLLNNPHSHQLIYLRDVKQQELWSILQFMYSGEANIHKNRINAFFINAKDLKINQLYDKVDEPENRKDDADCDDIANNKTQVIALNREIQDDVADENGLKSLTGTNDDPVMDTRVENPDDNIQNFVGKLHKCVECGAGYTRMQALMVHIRSKHEGIEYSCNQCEYHATQQSSLKTHKQSIHEGFKYPCGLCEYQATHRTILKTHKQYVHAGFKYSCDQCEYQALYKGSINGHKKSKHEGFKYSCDQCDYKATQPVNLRSHKQSKHGGVKYFCNQCDYKASQDTLRKHKKVKHDIS